MSELNYAYAVFDGNCNFTVTNRLWQWSYGQKLTISGIELPSTFEVQFCNRGDANTVTQIYTDGAVDIPDELMEKSEWIEAYVFLHNTANDGETVFKISVPVTARPEPSDITPTPVQQDVITETIAALDAAVESVPASIEAALAEAKASGEFDGADGADGNGIWEVDVQYTRTVGGVLQAKIAHMVGRSDVTPAAGDLCVVSDGRLCEIQGITGANARLTVLGDLSGPAGQDGQDGYSPSASVSKSGSTATITITDANGTTTATVTDGQDGEQGPAGPSGGQFWTAQSAYTTPNYTWAFSNLTGPTGGTPAVGDLVYYSTYRYTITSVDTANETVNCTIRASIRGAQGPAGEGVPAGGTTGQYLRKKTDTDYDTEWVSGGGGGGGTSDYTDLSNKPQINSVTLSGNKSLSDLGIAAASAVPAAATATPSDLGTAAVGSSAKYAKEDHVHKKPTYSKSDVGLGNVDNVQQYSASNPPPYPVTSVNGSTGAVSLSIPSSAGDVGAIPAPSSPSNGQYLMWNGSAWVAQTLPLYNGGVS